MSVHRLSREGVHELALDALHLASGGVRRNMCDPVANEFAMFAEERGIDARGATYASVDGAKHFVALLPAAEYADCDDTEGWVVVDPTLKQFEDRLGGDTPDVAVLPPGDDRRGEWYDDIRLPDA